MSERVAGLGGIAVLDAVRISRRHWPVPLLAALDWPAHFTTAALALTALPRRLDPEIAAWALAGSVAIDLDHIPLYLGLRSVVTEDGGRPVTHSLTTAGALLGAAVPSRGRARKVLAGLGAGVLLHLVRDIGTGGVPLLWPFRHGTVRVPYAAHFAAIAVAAALPALRRPRRIGGVDHRQDDADARLLAHGVGDHGGSAPRRSTPRNRPAPLHPRRPQRM